MTDSQPVTLRLRRDRHIAEVTLSRPAALNAINSVMAEELFAACHDLAADSEVRVVIIRGDGDRAFCAGADLKERAALDLADWRRQRELFRAMFRSARDLPQPVIASVQGYALGGGAELALLSDLIVASDDAVFGLPEARLGIIPGGNGVITLARAVGPRRAKELLFSGRRITAIEGFEIGMVTKVVPGSDLEMETDLLAQAILRSSPTSLRAMKMLVAAALGSLVDALSLEETLYQSVIASPNRLEGIRAFAESRDPQWLDE